MTRLAVLVSILLSTGQAWADDLIWSAQAATPQFAALSGVYAFGEQGGIGNRCFVEISPGVVGAKAQFGWGFVERHPDDRNQHTVIGVGVSGLYMWRDGPLAKAKATYVGPEVTLMWGWRLSIGVMKRVDSSGWTLSAGIGHAF